MTKTIIDDARRVAKALGWHPTAQPCQCWNCQANRALIAAADEIECLRAWQSRATQVLPLIDRQAGTQLAEFVGALLRNEVPPSTGAPEFDRRSNR